jgi:RNA recognition motif-containing protein
MNTRCHCLLALPVCDAAQPRGFAFVRFVHRRDADEALAKMEGAEVDGQHLKIQYAMERRPDNPRRYYEQTRGAREREAYGGGGGGGGGGYGGYRPRSR